MNARIKELMLEAGYAAPEIAVRAQKFAELIVRECADFADKGTRGGIGELMKQHFGVEE